MLLSPDDERHDCEGLSKQLVKHAIPRKKFHVYKCAPRAAASIDSWERTRLRLDKVASIARIC